MWLRVSLLRFGVPAGQIAVMHRIIVDEKTARVLARSHFSRPQQLLDVRQSERESGDCGCASGPGRSMQ